MTTNQLAALEAAQALGRADAMLISLRGNRQRILARMAREETELINVRQKALTDMERFGQENKDNQENKA
jgi:hypothetical protein